VNLAKAAIALLLASFVAAQAHAQSFVTVPPAALLSEPPAATNMVLVIRAGDLGGQTVALEINGSKAAELTSSQSYTAVYSPGRLRIAFAGDSEWKSFDTYAIANEEHVYELRLVTARKRGDLLSATQPGLVLVQRKTLVEGVTPAPEPAKPQTVAVTDLQSAQKQVISRRSEAGAWRELGRHYLAAGEPAKAARAYRQALRLQPGDADALQALGAIPGNN